MNTVIASDRIGRFAELDHAVVEEVRAFVESAAAMDVPAASQDRGRKGLLGRLGATLRASIPLPQRS